MTDHPSPSVPAAPAPPYRLFALRRHLARPAPEEPLGAGSLGEFIERGRRDGLTFLHGHADLASVGRRAQDRDAVLLLRPLYPDSGVALLPAVDFAAEPGGAQGLAVAHLFPVAPGRLASCAQAAEAWFVHYGGAGVTEAGILASADENPATEHGIAEAGGQLVWLGVLRDEAALASLAPLFDACAAALERMGLLSGPAELVVLEPMPRSRLRWISVTPAIVRPAPARAPLSTGEAA